jgi:hypothetical protein
MAAVPVVPAQGCAWCLAELSDAPQVYSLSEEPSLAFPDLRQVRQECALMLFCDQICAVLMLHRLYRRDLADQLCALIGCPTHNTLLDQYRACRRMFAHATSEPLSSLPVPCERQDLLHAGDKRAHCGADDVL